MVELCRWICCAPSGKPGRPLTDVAGRCCNHWGKKVNLVTSGGFNPCMCGVCVAAWVQFAARINCAPFSGLFFIFSSMYRSVYSAQTMQLNLSAANILTRVVNLDACSSAPANQLETWVLDKTSTDFTPISSNLPSCMLSASPSDSQ